MPTSTETFESYRPLLFSIAYRMLGSAMEAEDILQEAYLRFGAAQQREIRSPKSFLTTIVTHLCLDQLRSARAQRESYIGTWLPEPLLTASPSSEAEAGQRETISMAFLVLLERLSPTERAVFLLRDVFEYSYAEIAQIVGKSEANCRRYHHRARQFLVAQRPRFEPSSDEHRKLLEGFMQAMTTGDIDSLTAMLADDVVVYNDGGGKAPAALQPIIGRELAARRMERILKLLTPDIHFEIAEVNGTLSLLIWQNETLYGVMNFTIAGGQIREFHNVFNPDKLRHLSLHHQTGA